MELIDIKPDDGSTNSFTMQGCAGGVPYYKVIRYSCGETLSTWVNMQTGEVLEAEPEDFVFGECPKCDPVCPTGFQTTWSDVCPEPTPITQRACFQVCTATSATPIYGYIEYYQTDRAYDEIKNLAFTTGNATDGQYEVSVFNGRWTVHMNLTRDTAYADYAVLPTPLLVFQKDVTGLSSGVVATAEFDTYEVSNNGQNGEFRVEIVDLATGQVLNTGTFTATKTWVQHEVSFTVPSGGAVQYNIYSLRNGSASGNDPCIDDTGIRYTPSTCVIYRMVSENGVTTWYDQAFNVIEAPDLTDAERIACPPPVTETCYEKTTTTPGTPQSQPTGTTLSNAYDSWPRQTCDLSLFGDAVTAGTFPAPWGVEAGTPMNIRDDNGACPGDVPMARLDQGDAVAEEFMGYNGVVYRPNVMWRKVSADGLGATTVRLTLIRPDGTTQVIAERSSTRTGGSAGWDRIGTNALGGDSVFTATQTGVHKLVLETVSAAPARVLAPSVTVYNASSEVTSPVESTVFYKQINTNGVSVWYDANGNVISTPDLTGAVEVTCP